MKNLTRGSQAQPRATSALREYLGLLGLPEAPRASQEPQEREDSPLAGNANAMRTHSQ